MSKFKMIALVACLSLLTIGTASANPWRHGYYYGYRPGIYAYPPVVVPPPPPIVVAPAYPVPPPAYYPPPVPVYGPPVYNYGVIGPRGFGYASPGFGIYVGR